MDGQLIGERYVAAALLGSGSCGEVWAASDVEGVWRAVRLLDVSGADGPAVRRRAARLWPRLALVRHPHIVAARDLVDDPDHCVLVSDLIEGADLRSQLTCLGTIAPATVARWGSDIAGALHTLHAAGLAHGDLRPENVLVDAASGEIAICDAGVALIVTGEETDPEVDLYQLGVVLYELSCGRKPFGVSGGRAPAVRLLAVPERPDGVPDDLWDVLVTLLTGAESSAGRAAGALAVAARALRGLPAAPVAPAREPRHDVRESPERWRRRVTAATVAAVSAALLGGGVAAAALFAGGPEKEQPRHAQPTLESDVIEMHPDATGGNVDVGRATEVRAP